jgi:hypothetical protein
MFKVRNMDANQLVKTEKIVSKIDTYVKDGKDGKKRLSLKKVIWKIRSFIKLVEDLIRILKDAGVIK